MPCEVAVWRLAPIHDAPVGRLGIVDLRAGPDGLDAGQAWHGRWRLPARRKYIRVRLVIDADFRQVLAPAHGSPTGEQGTTVRPARGNSGRGVVEGDARDVALARPTGDLAKEIGAPAANHAPVVQSAGVPP